MSVFPSYSLIKTDSYDKYSVVCYPAYIYIYIYIYLPYDFICVNLCFKII